MVKVVELETERLNLRQWKDSDYPVFAEMSSDPEVMEFYPKVLSENESNEIANKIHTLIAKRGWGFWAVERKENNQFIGFVGLHEPVPELPFSPCVEIGWRLGKEHWGKGYATEAAKESLKYAFESLKLGNVVSFATVGNKRSRAVMERLNMVNTYRNFEHPELPVGSPLREHVLYELTKERWNETAV